MDTAVDEAWIKTEDDGEKGDVKMTEDEKYGDALSDLKDDTEVTSSSLSYVEQVGISEPALINENYSCLPQEVLTDLQGKTETLETTFKSAQSNTEGDFDEKMGIITSSEQSSNHVDTSKSENKIEEACEGEEITSFGNSNPLEGNIDLEECSNEQEELNTLELETGEFVSQIRPCNDGIKVSEQNSKSEHFLEQNQELSTQDSRDGISPAVSEDSFWELNHQEHSNSNGETASTVNEKYLLELNNELDSNGGTSVKEEEIWELETEELSGHQGPWPQDDQTYETTSSEHKKIEEEEEDCVRSPGIDKNEKSKKNVLKVHFANEEKEIGLLGEGEAEVPGVDLEKPEVKEELEDEEEFETGSSGSIAEDEGQEGDANFDDTNICEYRSAFQRVVAQMLSEREAREAAQSKLYVVEVALEKCVSNDLANLRLALMHVQLLLREQNRARDDIVRTLKNQEDLNTLLEEKVLLLQNQKHELIQELNQESDRVQELERTNQSLVNILKRYGIKNC